MFTGKVRTLGCIFRFPVSGYLLFKSLQSSQLQRGRPFRAASQDGFHAWVRPCKLAPLTTLCGDLFPQTSLMPLSSFSVGAHECCLLLGRGPETQAPSSWVRLGRGAAAGDACPCAAGVGGAQQLQRVHRALQAVLQGLRVLHARAVAVPGHRRDAARPGHDREALGGRVHPEEV